MTALPIRHFATTIGDGHSQCFVIEHGLNTHDVMVECLDANTFELIIEPTITHLDLNRIEVDFTHILTYSHPPKRLLRYRNRKGRLGLMPGRIPEPKSVRVLISG